MDLNYCFKNSVKGIVYTFDMFIFFRSSHHLPLQSRWRSIDWIKIKTKNDEVSKKHPCNILFHVIECKCRCFHCLKWVDSSLKILISVWWMHPRHFTLKIRFSPFIFGHCGIYPFWIINSFIKSFSPFIFLRIDLGIYSFWIINLKLFLEIQILLEIKMFIL